MSDEGGWGLRWGGGVGRRVASRSIVGGGTLVALLSLVALADFCWSGWLRSLSLSLAPPFFRLACRLQLLTKCWSAAVAHGLVWMLVAPACGGRVLVLGCSSFACARPSLLAKSLVRVAPSPTFWCGPPPFSALVPAPPLCAVCAFMDKFFSFVPLPTVHSHVLGGPSVLPSSPTTWLCSPLRCHSPAMDGALCSPVRAFVP